MVIKLTANMSLIKNLWPKSIIIMLYILYCIIYYYFFNEKDLVSHLVQCYWFTYKKPMNLSHFFKTQSDLVYRTTGNMPFNF